MSLPRPLELVKAHGFVVFGRPFSANLVVQRGPGGPGEWDGLLTLTWRERENGPWCTWSAPAATRPGWHYLEHPMNPRGTAMFGIAQNRLSHERGFHHAGTPSAVPAWVQVPGVEVLAQRDPNRNRIHEPGAIVRDATGMNVHPILDPNFLAGCVGALRADLDRLLEAYDWLDERYPQPRVSLTLVEG